jgi:hypothetical protein
MSRVGDVRMLVCKETCSIGEAIGICADLDWYVADTLQVQHTGEKLNVDEKGCPHSERVVLMSGVVAIPACGRRLSLLVADFGILTCIPDF